MKHNERDLKNALETPTATPGMPMEPHAPIPKAEPPALKKEKLTTKEDLLKEELPFQTKDLLSKDEKEKLKNFSADRKKDPTSSKDYNFEKEKTLTKEKFQNEEKNTNYNKEEDENMRGELTYDDKVIQKIVGVALGEVEGLLSIDGGFFSNLKEKLVNSDDVTAGIETEVGKKQVAVDMDVVVEYGKDIEKIFEQIKDVISREVEHMTHLEVVEVNVNVVDIKTKEQYEKESETVQDKLSDTWEDTKEFASKQTEKAKGALDKGKDKVEDKIDEAKEPRVE